MTKRRIITLITSTVLAGGLIFGLFANYTAWSPATVHLSNVALAVYFLAILISNQQYRENLIARIERIVSAGLFSYLVFIQMLYAPMARYFFGYLIQQRFFLSDILALLLFLFFIFLFGTSTLVLNSYSRLGFLSQWTLFNNPTAYFVLRSFWLASVSVTAFLYWQMPFIIITV